MSRSSSPPIPPPCSPRPPSLWQGLPPAPSPFRPTIPRTSDAPGLLLLTPPSPHLSIPQEGVPRGPFPPGRGPAPPRAPAPGDSRHPPQPRQEAALSDHQVGSSREDSPTGWEGGAGRGDKVGGQGSGTGCSIVRQLSSPACFILFVAKSCLYMCTCEGKGSWR